MELYKQSYNVAPGDVTPVMVPDDATGGVNLQAMKYSPATFPVLRLANDINNFVLGDRPRGAASDRPGNPAVGDFAGGGSSQVSPVSQLSQITFGWYAPSISPSPRVYVNRPINPEPQNLETGGCVMWCSSMHVPRVCTNDRRTDAFLPVAAASFS
eukprot:4906645-Pyramimonas_sp.AAC.2